MYTLTNYYLSTQALSDLGEIEMAYENLNDFFELPDISELTMHPQSSAIGDHYGLLPLLKLAGELNPQQRFRIEPDHHINPKEITDRAYITSEEFQEMITAGYLVPVEQPDQVILRIIKEALDNGPLNIDMKILNGKIGLYKLIETLIHEWHQADLELIWNNRGKNTEVSLLALNIYLKHT